MPVVVIGCKEELKTDDERKAAGDERPRYTLKAENGENFMVPMATQ